MKQINVKKEELLNKLKENRDKHAADVKNSLKGYRQTVLEKLDEIREKVVRDLEFSLSELHHLSKPIDKTEDYDRAIQMLEMEVNDTVEITTDEFRCYVQDEWDWKHHFLASNTQYLNKF